MTGTPLTREEKVLVLEPMLECTARNASREAPGMRIVEFRPTLAVICERDTLRRMQWETRRGLKLACIVLTGAMLRSCFDGDTFLTALLGPLAFLCLPLDLLASPDPSEVRS